MKISRLAMAGAATALVAGAVIASPAVAGGQSVSWSQSTLCPGETVTLTINGISDSQPIILTSPEFFRVQEGDNPKVLYSNMFAGGYSWQVMSIYQGQTYTVEIITTDPNDPTAGTVHSTTSLQILSECAAPAPEPEAEALPDTGASAGTMTALALGAAALGLGGAVLARRARRVASSK